MTAPLRVAGGVNRHSQNTDFGKHVPTADFGVFVQKYSFQELGVGRSAAVASVTPEPSPARELLIQKISVKKVASGVEDTSTSGRESGVVMTPTAPQDSTERVHDSVFSR